MHSGLNPLLSRARMNDSGATPLRCPDISDGATMR
jgi:hypothetical protein